MRYILLVKCLDPYILYLYNLYITMFSFLYHLADVLCVEVLQTLICGTFLTIWLNRLLVELQPQKEPSKLVTIFEDSQSAICMAKNSQFHGRSKHIDIKYHFNRDETKKGTIDIQYCRTDNVIADMLTKGLYAERFEKLRDMAGVKEFSLIQSEKEC